MNKKNEVLTSFFRKKVHNFRGKTKKGSFNGCLSLLQQSPTR